MYKGTKKSDRVIRNFVCLLTKLGRKLYAVVKDSLMLKSMIRLCGLYILFLFFYVNVIDFIRRDFIFY